MPPFHAVVWTDHQSAQALQFDAQHVLANNVKAHTHHTQQHGGAVRSEHGFFGEGCDALNGVAEVMVRGSHTAPADFRHHADKHRAQTAARIVGYEVVEHPSDHQLVALAHNTFSSMTGWLAPRRRVNKVGLIAITWYLKESGLKQQ